MTFYGTTATAAGLVVPKKYVQQVGGRGVRKHPIGAGPYKFASHAPGVEVVLEAYNRVHGAGAQRQAARHEERARGHDAGGDAEARRADIAFALDGEDAENVRRDPKLQLVRPSTPRSTGSSSPSSGTPSRRGTTSGCARP